MYPEDNKSHVNLNIPIPEHPVGYYPITHVIELAPRPILKLQVSRYVGPDNFGEWYEVGSLGVTSIHKDFNGLVPMITVLKGDKLYAHFVAAQVIGIYYE